MNLDIAFRDIDATDGIRNHIGDRAEKLERFLNDDEHVRVVVGTGPKGQPHYAEVYWHDNRQKRDYFAKAEGGHLYTQIDEVFEKIFHQIQKNHDREITRHHKKDPLKKAVNGNGSSPD